MDFVSSEYFILLAVAVTASRTLPHRAAVWAVLIASLVFYGWGHPSHLLILFAVGGIAYLGGLLIDRYRSFGLLWLLIITACVLLFYYKYYAAGVRIVNDVLGSVWHGYVPAQVVQVALPIGISFFTFQAISYIVDVYRRDIKPERSAVDFMLFKAFFPQLVAGPIERAAHLMPQLKRLGTPAQPPLDLAGGGLMILKGVLVKFVFADNLAEFVEASYANLASATPLDALLSMYFFTLQIYGDFYGYTMIALGSARLFGVTLINNFNHPYFAQSIQQFWRRWHISLSSWFRDYVYIPLGGNQRRPARVAFNLIATMMLTALWHGASYNFLIWGTGHAALLLIHRVYSRFKDRRGWSSPLPGLTRPLSWFVTLHCVALLWVPFRAPNVGAMSSIFAKIGDGLAGSGTLSVSTVAYMPFYAGIAIAFCLFAILDWRVNLEEGLARAGFPAQALAVTAVLLLTYLAPLNGVQFIYFQF